MCTCMYVKKLHLANKHIAVMTYFQVTADISDHKVDAIPYCISHIIYILVSRRSYASYVFSHWSECFVIWYWVAVFRVTDRTFTPNRANSHASSAIRLNGGSMFILREGGGDGHACVCEKGSLVCGVKRLNRINFWRTQPNATLRWPIT